MARTSRFTRADVARESTTGYPRKVRCHLCGHKFIAWTLDDANRLQHGTGCTDCARAKMDQGVEWNLSTPTVKGGG